MPLDNCQKQIRLHTKLRETYDDVKKIYDIKEIEFDQYHLELISINETPATGDHHIMLTCEQLKKYKFEVENPNA